MKQLLCLIVCLLSVTSAFSQSVPENLQNIGSIDNIVYVQSPTGLQGAINEVCSSGVGGTVILPTLANGVGQAISYVQNSPLTLCSNLNLVGMGKSENATSNGTASGSVSCPTLIQTDIGSGDDFFVISGMTDIRISDLCVQYTGSGSPNAVFRLDFGQYVTIERVTIFGGPANNTSAVGFQVGLELNNNSNGPGSTIYNHFSDINMYNLAKGGVGCLLFATNTSSSNHFTTINNNYFDNVNCIGGYAGRGLQVTGGGVGVPDINEDVFRGGQFTAEDECPVTLHCPSSSGYGVIIGSGSGSGSSRDLTMTGADIENNYIGLHLSSQNNGFACYGCNISSNTVNTQIVSGSTGVVLTGNIGGS